MTRYAQHLADAWAEFWSAGDTRAAAVVYARDVRWWDVARGRGKEAAGRDAIVVERAAITDGADRFGLSVRRVVPAVDAVAVEFVVAARECGALVAAPACAFWRVDGDGRIAREQWFWDWSGRGPAEPSIVGHTVVGAGGERGPRWYRNFATEVLAAWDASPPAMVDQYYAADVVFDTMGAGSSRVLRGADALRDAETRLEARLVERRTRVAEVVGAGPLVACAHFTEARTAEGPRRTTPVARVWTLGADNRIVSDHTYLVRAWPPRSRR